MVPSSYLVDVPFVWLSFDRFFICSSFLLLHFFLRALHTLFISTPALSFVLIFVEVSSQVRFY